MEYQQGGPERPVHEESEPKGQVIVAVIENDEGQILLILRKKENVWAFPSGLGATYIFHEKPEKAVHSEVSYDTKLILESAEEFMNEPIEGNTKADAMIAFACKAKGGQTIILNPKSAKEYAWVDKDDSRLEQLPFDQPDVWEAYKNL